MGKKGGSEIDWAVSLAIFLMYIAWFFIYISPLTKEPEDQGSSLKRIADKLKANATWTVETVPLMIWSNISGRDEPVISDFPYRWNETSFAFTNNNSFLLDEGKIFFMINLSEGRKITTIAHSSESYNRPSNLQKSISATNDYASTANMKADFKNSKPDKIEFADAYLLLGANITVGNQEPEIENTSVLISTDIIKYKMQAKGFNHSSYIFAQNPRIYTVIKTAPYSNMNISASFTLGNLTSYYSDNMQGNFNFNNSCKDIKTNYLDAYTEISGISFIFNNKENVSLCMENHTIKLKVHFENENETRYNIFLHTGDYNSTLKHKAPYTVSFGVIQDEKGLSSKYINKLNTSNYSSIKSMWSVKNDFSFTVVNMSNSAIFSYEKSSPPQSANIFAKETETSMLDQYGNREKARIRVRMW